MRRPYRFHRLAAPALGVGLAVLGCAGMAYAQMFMPQQKPFKSGAGPDELWDVTMKMEMPGMPMAMPAQRYQLCLKKGRNTGAEAVPKDAKCKIADLKVDGNKTTFAIDCAGDEPMTGRGEITSSPSAYDGRMTMKSKRHGDEMAMSQTFSGRRVGACTE